MEHDMPDLISYREVRAKIGSALDNCGYLDQESFKAAIVLVVEEALAAGVTVDELQDDVRLATQAKWEGKELDSLWAYTAFKNKMHNVTVLSENERLLTKLNEELQAKLTARTEDKLRVQDKNYELEDELEALRGERRRLRRELEDLKYQRENKAQAYVPSGPAAPGESCVCNVPGCPEGPTNDLMNKAITRDPSK